MKNLYHGTNNAIEICSDHFDVEKSGAHDPGDLGRGIYLHTRKSFSQNYGKTVLTAEVKLNKPFIIDFDQNRDGAYKTLDELTDKWGNPVRGCAYYSTEEIMKRAEERGVHPGDLCRLERREASERWRDELQAAGYDGVIAHGYEGRNTTTVVVFNPERIRILDCFPRSSRECEVCEEKIGQG